MSYKSSLLTVLALTIGSLLGLAIAIEKTIGWDYCLIGGWIGSLGVVFLGWRWLSPNQIIAWQGLGIDNHPHEKNRVLINYKEFSLWKQPNRLKLTVAFVIIAFGGLLASIGQTFDFYS